MACAAVTLASKIERMFATSALFLTAIWQVLSKEFGWQTLRAPTARRTRIRLRIDHAQNQPGPRVGKIGRQTQRIEKWTHHTAARWPSAQGLRVRITQFLGRHRPELGVTISEVAWQAPFTRRERDS